MPGDARVLGGYFFLVVFLLRCDTSAGSASLLFSTFMGAIGCPRLFFKCLGLSPPCRQTLACAGNCFVENKMMNLTCFVPCSTKYDQTVFNELSVCLMKPQEITDDPGVIDLPMEGRCLDMKDKVEEVKDISSLEGRWYIVGGASTLEAYDCQANQWSRHNSTHWTVDEYFQGYITGLGFQAMNNRQIASSPKPGVLLWDAEPGHSGYRATYQMLQASGDDYVISYYCAPLDPTTKSWTSVVVYSRTPHFPSQAKETFLALLAELAWDQTPTLVNHDNCTYLLPSPMIEEDRQVAVDL